MEKAKLYLAVAKKHHFWIFCGVAVIVAFASWSTASSTLDTESQANRSTIENTATQLSQLSAGELPNSSFTEEVEKLHEVVKNSVYEAWERLFQQQQELFQWPIEVADIGQIPSASPIPQERRIFYNNNVVRDEWERVFEQVDLLRLKPEEVAEAEDEDDEDNQFNVAGRGPADYEGLVAWSPASRKAIVDRYYSASTPSSLRVRLTQEDLWVFEWALVSAIRSANSGANDPLQATVKQINFLDLGQTAVVAVKGGGAGGGMMNGMSMGMGQGMGQGMGGGAGRGGGGGKGSGATQSEETLLLQDRYLGADGQPIGPGSQPFAEFKQMLVHMKVVMDQRRIPELLASCANAPLPIEVRQVSMTLGEGGRGLQMGGGGGPMAGGGGMGAGMGQGMGQGIGQGMGQGMGAGMGQGMGAGMGQGMGAGMGQGMGAGMGQGMGAGVAGAAAGRGGGAVIGVERGLESSPHDALVELSGVVYIYNPPDPAKLGTGSASNPADRAFAIPTGGQAAGQP